MSFSTNTSKPPRTLVIVVHPNLAESRINKRLAEELDRRGAVTVHRLHEAYPDEIIDVARERELLEAHDIIVLQFPFYWYSAPAMLKKWLDTVFLSGWAYGPGGDRLQGKDLMLSVTTGGTLEAYQAGGYNHYSYSELLRPYQATAHRVGMNYRSPYIVSGVREVTDEQLEKHAADYADYVQKAQTARAARMAKQP